MSVQTPSLPSSLNFHLGRSGVGLILLYGISLLLGYHLTQRTLTMHEVVFAQPAKEMLSSGDWLVPRVAGVVFPDKPLMTMWLIAGSITLTGSESEWAVRLPSSLATLLTALIIGATAARRFGQRVGIFAGFIQLSSYYMLQMATLAESDMILIFGVTAALCFFAWVHIESPAGRWQGRWTPWVFHALLGFVLMVKGPVGVIFIALSTGCFMLITRQWSLFKFFFHPGGLLLIAVMSLPYPFLSGMRYPPIMDEWLMHNWGRFEGDLPQIHGKEPFYFYLYHLPLLLLPWFPCLFLAMANRQLWKMPIVWWSICTLIPSLLFLSTSAWKWKHYLSPVLPGMTLLMAWGLDRWFYVLSHIFQRYWRPLMVTSLLIGVTGIVIIQREQPVGALPTTILIAVGAVCAMIVLELSHRQWLRYSVPALFIMIWAMTLGVFGFVLPAHDNCRIQAEFAERINQRSELTSALHLVNLNYDQIIYYLKKPVVRTDRLEHFIDIARQSIGPSYVLIKQKDVTRLQELGTYSQIDYCPNPRRRAGPGEALVLLRLDTGVKASR